MKFNTKTIQGGQKHEEATGSVIPPIFQTSTYKQSSFGVAQEYNKVIIVSTKSGFTPQALQHASNNSSLIELWDSTRFIQELKDHSLNIY